MFANTTDIGVLSFYSNKFVIFCNSNIDYTKQNKKIEWNQIKFIIDIHGFSGSLIDKSLIDQQKKKPKYLN